MVSARAGSSTSTVWKMAPSFTAAGSRPAAAAPARIALDRGRDVGRMRPDPDEHAVGDPARHPQGLRPARGDPHRHRPVMR